MHYLPPLATGLRFPEGPVFAPDGSLWCVELKGGGLVRWREGNATRFATGGAPNGAAIDAAGRVWFCDAGQNAIRRFDPRTRRIKTIADQAGDRPLDQPNDLAFDHAGNLLFTCPGDSRRRPIGAVCCRSPDGSVNVVAEGLFFPNGLALSLDGSELVVAETYRQRLWRGPWDAANCKWGPRLVWADGLVGAPGPDGMAFAADGTLFVAVYGAGAVVRLNVAGRIVARYPTPGHNPTNCAFDPTGELGLVVTEAERGELLRLPLADRGAALPRPTRLVAATRG